MVVGIKKKKIYPEINERKGSFLNMASRVKMMQGRERPKVNQVHKVRLSVNYF